MKKILTLSFSLSICFFTCGQNVLAEHHFESEDITEVTVMGAFCDVFVTRGDKVIFDGVIEGNGDEDDFIIASIKNGDKVLFKVERKSNYSWVGGNVKKARFEITIPDNVLLKIDNTSGDVGVSDLSGSEYRIESTSGDINVRNLDGPVRIKSTSGDITLIDITGAVVMESTSGDQEMTGISGNLKTRSTSGDILVEGLAGNLSAVATSGDIEMSRVEGALSIETTSGSITGEAVNLQGDSDVRATSGSVSFDFTNDLEEIGFDLRASSGDIEVGSVRAEDELTINRGKIRFRAVTTSGDQEYD